MHPILSRTRDKWYPAYLKKIGTTVFYIALMPKMVEVDGELPDEYIKELADPKHKPNTAVRFFDAMIPRLDKKGAPVAYGPQHFFIGENNECLTIVGRAQPCVDHNLQLGYVLEGGAVKTGINATKAKNRIPVDECPGAHYYMINKGYQKIVREVCMEYQERWNDIQMESQSGHHYNKYRKEFSVYLLRTEDVNTEDVKTMLTAINRRPGWTLRRLKNGFNLFYETKRTVMRKAFHVSRIYDAIDFMGDATPVFSTWEDTRGRE